MSWGVENQLREPIFKLLSFFLPVDLSVDKFRVNEHMMKLFLCCGKIHCLCFLDVLQKEVTSNCCL